MGLILILPLFLAMWFFLILPRQRQMKAHQALVASLAVGDEVMTTAGLYGTIVELGDDVVHLEVAQGTVLRFARPAIATRTTEPEADGALGSDNGSGAEDGDEASTEA